MERLQDAGRQREIAQVLQLRNLAQQTLEPDTARIRAHLLERLIREKPSSRWRVPASSRASTSAKKRSSYACFVQRTMRSNR